MRKAYTIQSGLVAILIYILIVLIAVWAFVENDKETQSSGSNEQSIKVDMSTVDVSTNSHTSKANTKNQEITKQEDIKKKTEETSKVSPQVVEKEIIKSKDNTPKEKLVAKTQDKEIIKTVTNAPKVKKDATSLFDAIDAKIPSQTIKKSDTLTQKQTTSNLSLNSNTQVSKKASDLINGTSLEKNNGVEEGYKSKVKSILNGWPAQSDFAGNKAKIKFIIESSGRFEFDVISQSSNEEFNKGLIQYLKQLQKVGFGAHGGNRDYVFNVDFIAEK
ncbi:MAG: TonB C-terminal domain-containing protein [Sulfurovaceae bacterium]|nr:TonB C-terminal domain-containing protein [Sulfurovaceae bacterium]